MRILRRVDESVLWLSAHNATATENLRNAAIENGIRADRLIFAGHWQSLPEHLARYRAADLFLDTLPYNAHKTASDALWVGTPVLTRAGETFAGRVAASLLHAIGLPELITSSEAQYEDLAVELAEDPPRFARIKETLAQNRRAGRLFDTPAHTRHLERAYETIHARYHDDLPPQPIRLG
jgi:predicted O-linked N-acetylglucosamine transferase (SPINDLY family)